MDIVLMFHALANLIGYVGATLVSIVVLGLSVGTFVVLPIIVGIHLPGLLIRFLFRVIVGAAVIWVIFAMSLPG